MASSSETGNAKNIANFFKLLQTDTGFGVPYNPTNNAIKLATMTAQYTDADGKQQSVNAAFAAFAPLVNAREIAFEPLSKTVTRALGILTGSGAAKSIIDDAKTLARKLTGRRASKAISTPADPAGTSSSQMSFDKRIDNFDAFVQILINEPLYNPNELDLKIVALQALLTSLISANNAVKTGISPLQQARIVRNAALYTKGTGLVDVALTSKAYVKGVFGARSQEFKLVNGIEFKKVKI